MLLLAKHNLKERLAYALNDIARAYVPDGRLADSTAAIEEAQSLWRELENWSMLADNLATSANNHAIAGRWSLAIAAAQEGVEISRTTGNYWGLAYNLAMMARAVGQTGEIGQALHSFEQAIPIAQKGNFLAADIFIPGLISRLHLLYGNLPAAAEYAAQGIRRGEEMEQGVVGVYFTDGLIQVELGNLAIAQQRLDSIVTLALMDPSNHRSILLALLQFEIAFHQGDYKQANAVLSMVIETQDLPGNLVLLVDLFLAFGRLLSATEQWEAAAEQFEKARHYGEQLQMRRVLWQVYIYLADNAVQREDTAKAQHYNRLAHIEVDWLAERLGAPDRIPFLRQHPLLKKLQPKQDTL